MDEVSGLVSLAQGQRRQMMSAKQIFKLPFLYAHPPEICLLWRKALFLRSAILVVARLE